MDIVREMRVLRMCRAAPRPGRPPGPPGPRLRRGGGLARAARALYLRSSWRLE